MLLFINVAMLLFIEVALVSLVIVLFLDSSNTTPS
jgi:hypothetical protein